MTSISILIVGFMLGIVVALMFWATNESTKARKPQRREHRWPDEGAR